MERGVYMRRRGSARVRAPLLALLVLAGCTGDPGPQTATVDPPEGGGWAECPPTVSRALAIPFRGAATNATGDRPVGIHRLDAQRFLYVWGNFTDTLREDRITRVNPIQLAVDGANVTHVCARVDVSSPSEVDTERRSYGVGVLLQADAPLPNGTIRVVVNWVAGCACDPLPKGNASAVFDG